MKKEFVGQASVPKDIKYNRSSGGNDGDTSGSGSMVSKIGEELDDAGFQTTGYQVKKGTPFVMGAQIGTILNTMPPGMFIDNQQITDIRSEPFKQIVDTKGYPGDGWTGGGTDKLGR
jgi:hypothetical protein